MTIYISLLMRLLTKTLHPSAPAPSPLSNYRTHCNTTGMEAQKHDLQLAFSSLDCFSIEKLQSKYFLSPKKLMKQLLETTYNSCPRRLGPRNDLLSVANQKMSTLSAKLIN